MCSVVFCVFFMFYDKFVLPVAKNAKNCCAFTSNINSRNKSAVCVAVIVPEAMGVNLHVSPGHLITTACPVQNKVVQ